MADQSEYNQLVNERASARRQYNDCARRIENYEYILKSFRQAKGSVVDLKSSFKETKKKDSKMLKDKHKWEGSTYNKFKKKMDKVNSVNEDYYEKSLDHVLDSLNNKITEYENKRLRERGLLGRLGSWINSLSNQIENWVN